MFKSCMKCSNPMASLGTLLHGVCMCVVSVSCASIIQFVILDSRLSVVIRIYDKELKIKIHNKELKTIVRRI